MDSSEENVCLGTIAAISRLFFDEPDDDEETEVELSNTYADSIRTIIQYNHHVKLVKLLKNPSKSISLNSAGALKNICIAGGSEFCEVLNKCNISNVLIEIFTSMTLENDGINLNYINNIISLCSVLCEENDEILIKLTQPAILDKIFLILSTLSSDISLMLITSEYLYILSENNQSFCSYIESSQNKQNMINVINNTELSDSLILLYFIGIIFNTFTNSVNYNIQLPILLNIFNKINNNNITNIMNEKIKSETDENGINEFNSFIIYQSLLLEILSIITIDYVAGDKSNMKMIKIQQQMYIYIIINIIFRYDYLISNNIFDSLLQTLYSIPSLENINIIIIKTAIMNYIEYIIGNLNNIIENFPINSISKYLSDLWSNIWKLIPKYTDISFLLNLLWTIIRQSSEINLSLIITNEQV